MRSITFQGDGVDIALGGGVGGGDVGHVESALVSQRGAHGAQDLGRTAGRSGALRDQAGRGFGLRVGGVNRSVGRE